MIGGEFLLLILKIVMWVIVLRILGFVGDYFYKKLMEQENENTKGEEYGKEW